jgi:tetratricopeptide (TPR) repeat protein
LAEALYSIAQRYRNSPKPDYAKAALVYRKIAADYPSTGYAAKSRVYAAAADTMAMIDSIADSEPNQAAMERINASLADMKAAYAANPELCGAMLAVAEKCYAKGLSQMYQTPDPQNALLRLCRDVLENNIIGKTSDKYLNAEAYYILGLDYQNLGDYVKASQKFCSAFETNPKHRYADYCLFAAGRCYEKLLVQGTISEDEAKAIIRAAYSELVSKFPESRYSRLAAKSLATENTD